MKMREAYKKIYEKIIESGGSIYITPKGCGQAWEFVECVEDKGVWCRGVNGEGKLVRSFFEFEDYGRSWTV